jgi:hypothetical protein
VDILIHEDPDGWSRSEIQPGQVSGPIQNEEKETWSWPFDLHEPSDYGFRDYKLM